MGDVLFSELIQCSRHVNKERIVFAFNMPKPEHLARQKQCNLFLDTFLYDAQTTAADALWVGLPILTLPGKTYTSRVAGSLLAAAGATELLATSKEDYISKAVEFATTKRSNLDELQHKLSTVKTPLFDTPTFVRDLESLYQKIWKDNQHCHEEL